MWHITLWVMTFVGLMDASLGQEGREKQGKVSLFGCIFIFIWTPVNGQLHFYTVSSSRKCKEKSKVHSLLCIYRIVTDCLFIQITLFSSQTMITLIAHFILCSRLIHFSKEHFSKVLLVQLRPLSIQSQQKPVALFSLPEIRVLMWSLLHVIVHTRVSQK